MSALNHCDLGEKTSNKKLEKTKKGSRFNLFLKKFDSNQFNIINRVEKENLRIIT